MAPWEVVGFRYEHPGDVPICWRWWGLDYLHSQRVAQQERMRRMRAG